MCFEPTVDVGDCEVSDEREEKGMKKFNYYVSYAVVENGKLTVGHCTIDRTKPIKHTNDIPEISKEIAQKINVSHDVSIINFIRLRGKK